MNGLQSEIKISRISEPDSDSLRAGTFFWPKHVEMSSIRIGFFTDIQRALDTNEVSAKY